MRLISWMVLSMLPLLAFAIPMDEQPVRSSRGRPFKEMPSYDTELPSLGNIVQYYYEHNSEWRSHHKDTFVKHYISRQPLASLDPRWNPVDFVEAYVQIHPPGLQGNDRARMTRFLNKLLSMYETKKGDRKDYNDTASKIHQRYFKDGAPDFFEKIREAQACHDQYYLYWQHGAVSQNSQGLTELPRNYYSEGAFIPSPFSNVHPSYLSGTQGRPEEASQGTSQYHSEEGSSARHYRNQPFGVFSHEIPPSYGWKEHHGPSQTNLDTRHMGLVPPSSSSAKFQEHLPCVPQNFDIPLHEFPDLRRPETVHGQNPYNMQHDPHPANNPPQQHDPFFMQQQSEMPHYPQPFPFQDPASHYHPDPRLPPPR